MIAAIVLAAAVQIQATDYALSLPSIIPSVSRKGDATEPVSR